MINSFIEIKNRFILINITVLSMFVTGYYYKTFLLILIIVSNSILVNEILNYFIFTSITELFLIYFLVIFFLTNQVLYFIVVYQIICFLAPGLYKKEYKFFKYLFFLCVVFGLLSICFFFKQVVLLVSTFFLSFQNYSIQTISFYFEAKIYEYLLFYKDLYISCFFVFQSFVFLILLAKYISNNIRILQTTRKFIYILLLTFSTIVTPPDVLSQLFIFLSFLIGFEILVFVNLIKTFLIR